MNTATPLPTGKTIEIDGYVVKRGCEFMADSGRWRPVVSIGEGWDESTHAHLPVGVGDLQDSAGQALDWADVMARKWIRAERTHPARHKRRA